MKILFSVFLLFSSFINAQITGEIITLNSISPNDPMTDLKSLDQYIEGKKIIGVGESTHGTSEFTTMRHRFFKYLVEEKGFTVFFLEADVSACRRVNRYIHGASDTVRSAIKEFNLWPWLTEEMVELVEWCKTYNQTAKVKIEFVGCDMQLISDDKKELQRLFTDKSYQADLNEIFKDLKSPNNDTVQSRKKFFEWKAFVSRLETENNEQINSIEFALIKKSIDQWFENELAGKYKYNFRDSFMAENMIYYQQQHPETKAMYFAHNWHVSKYKHDYKSGVPSMKSCGRYLSDRIGESYLCLAMVTNEGKLNARSYDRKENGYYVFEIKPSKNGTIENELSKQNTSLLFYKVQKDDKLDDLKCTEIGAAYGRNKYGIKYPRYNQLQNGCYDGFFFIEKTKETKLIKKQENI